MEAAILPKNEAPKHWVVGEHIPIREKVNRRSFQVSYYFDLVETLHATLRTILGGKIEHEGNCQARFGFRTLPDTARGNRRTAIGQANSEPAQPRPGRIP